MLKTRLPGDKACEWIKRDKAVISPSYPRGYPFVMEHGRGVEVWDVDGNRFLDFSAGIAVASTGHSHPQVVKAIQEQAEKFIHISSDFYHQKWIELAERMDQIAPFAEDAISFMANSGAESIESAIKLARFFTRRTEFIGFLGGFHGRTMGAVTFTASKASYHRGFFPLLSGVVHAPFPNPYRPVLASNPGEDYGETVVRYIEDEIFGRIVPADAVAGILVEPIQGEGGYIIPPAGFFPALRRLCDRHGILLIADEVQSGVGRTGKWWGIENFGVEPDIFCVAKGIASGMPLGMMIARKSIVTWPKGSHGNTYGGNPLSCSAALATLDLIENGMMQNAVEVGEFALQKLRRMQENHPSIGEVRGIGLMIGIEFVCDRQTRGHADNLRDRIVDIAFEKGLLTLGAGRNVIRISPPLNISLAEMEEGLEILDQAIFQAEQELSPVHQTDLQPC
ncbi:MAG: acetyl ornithine aminotransferase family protein [Bellilinea sp.]|jgi:4-aminobutyrate aminotransferase